LGDVPRLDGEGLAGVVGGERLGFLVSHVCSGDGHRRDCRRWCPKARLLEAAGRVMGSRRGAAAGPWRAVPNVSPARFDRRALWRWPLMNTGEPGGSGKVRNCPPVGWGHELPGCHVSTRHIGVGAAGTGGEKGALVSTGPG